MRFGMIYPLQVAAAIPGLFSFTFDQAADQAEFLVSSETSDPITHVGVRWNSVGATPGSYTISIQGVTGAPLDPDGTVKGATNNALKSFTPSGTGLKWYALDETFTPTIGELFFIVLKPDALPTNASSINPRMDAVASVLPRYTTYENGTTRTRYNSCMCFGYKTASRVYGRPLSAITSVVADSATTPDEVGVYFTIPTNVCSTYKILAMQGWMRTTAANASFVFKLYEGSTLIATGTVDGDYSDAVSIYRMTDLTFTETTMPTMTAGTLYRLTLQPPTSTDDIGFPRFDQPAGESANWEAWDGGTWFGYTSRTNAGAFTDEATQRPSLGFILSDISQAPTQVILSRQATLLRQ